MVGGGRSWAVVGGAACAVAGALLLLRSGEGSVPGAPGPPVAVAGRPPESDAAAAPSRSARARPLPRPPGATAGPPAPVPPLLAPPPASGPRPIDLEGLRQKLPRNLYWQLGVPTDDSRLLREREEYQRGWDEIFGRIQSGTATEEEIASYYDHRRQLSEDYRAFSLQVLADQGDELDERDRGLHEMSVRMHTQRLEELPLKQEQALARKRQQDAQRDAWERAGRPRPP